MHTLYIYLLYFIVFRHYVTKKPEHIPIWNEIYNACWKWWI